MKRQARRGRFFMSAHNEQEEASALFSGLVKDVLGPTWVGQAMEIDSPLGLGFMRRDPQIPPGQAFVDATSGGLEHPTHLIKFKASRRQENIRDGYLQLLAHRNIARREWPKMQAIYVVVDTSRKAKIARCAAAVTSRFELNLEALQTPFRNDEIAVVVLQPRDLMCFAMCKRVVDSSRLELLEALGC
jgi:hypothetical protein